MKILEAPTGVKYYMVGIGLFLVYFVWAQATGTRILGDDNQSKESRKGQSHFYHK